MTSMQKAIVAICYTEVRIRFPGTNHYGYVFTAIGADVMRIVRYAAMVCLVLACAHCGAAAIVSSGDAGTRDSLPQADGNAGFGDGGANVPDGNLDSASWHEDATGATDLSMGEDSSADGGERDSGEADGGEADGGEADAGPCPGRCHYDGSANMYQPGVRAVDGSCSVSGDMFRCGPLDGCDPLVGCVAP